MASYERVEEFEEVEAGEYLPKNTVDEAPVLPQTDDDRLDFTQDIRGMVINQLMVGGKVPITDKDQMGVLLKALDGIDKQALGKKRLDVTKDAARDLNSVAKLLEEASKQLIDQHGVDPAAGYLKNQPARDPNVFKRDITNDFSDILDEELALERREENSEEFFRRYEEENNIQR